MHSPLELDREKPYLKWFLLLGLTFLWGSSFALIKQAVTELSPASVVFLRLLIGSLILLPLLVVLRKKLPYSKKSWLYIALLALFGNALPFILISWGQQYIDSGLAGILMSTMPLSTLLMAHFFIPNEKATGLKIIGFCLGFAGVFVLIGFDKINNFSFSGYQLLAQLSVLTGSFCYAISAIIAKFKPKSDPWASSTSILFTAALLVLPFATLTSGFSNKTDLLGLPTLSNVHLFSQSTLFSMIILGILSTGAATVIYLKLIELAGPTFLSIINYLIPVYAVILGAIVWNERLAINHFIALLMILTGLAVSQIKQLSKL